MDQQRIERTAEVLRDDYHRQGSQLSMDQLIRVVEKRGLDAEEALEVQRRLATEGILPETPENEEDVEALLDVLKGADSPSLDIVRLYLREIGRVPLLYAEDEVRLGRRMRAGEEAEQLATRTSSTPELEEAIETGRAAKRLMISANLRLVVNVAKRYIGRSGLDLSDLIQEGTLGLIRAAEKFDHTLGYKFSTYAMWWIRQSITRGMADKGRTIRLPVHIVEKLNQVRQTIGRLTHELDRQPTLREVADQLGENPATVQFLIEVGQEPTSLDTPIDGSDGESSTLGDYVSSTHVFEVPDQVVDRGTRLQTIQTLFSALSARERRILELRFGITDQRPRTLEEIGKEFGVTRERIRQIEKGALEKVRSIAKRMGVDVLDL